MEDSFKYDRLKLSAKAKLAKEPYPSGGQVKTDCKSRNRAQYRIRRLGYKPVGRFLYQHAHKPERQKRNYDNRYDAQPAARDVVCRQRPRKISDDDCGDGSGKNPEGA